jgi:hypothetical protein
MLDTRSTTEAEAPIGELFGRLAEDGKAYVRAEVGLYKAIAARRAGQARNGAIALAAALFIANAALFILLVGLTLELALHVGPALAGIIVFAVLLTGAFFLVRYGAGKMKALTGDADERAALAVGEKAA